jgi:hypothetical protein
MMEIVGTDAVRIDVVAETLGTTARTLQRRLAENGATFAGVLRGFGVPGARGAADIEHPQSAR